MTTKRTPIRGRLAVRGAANRPPWGGRKAGHASIVAPLASTLAATLAATVVIGVGVALARAERSRRSTRTASARYRQFALLPSEQLGCGLQRMAIGQLDLAIGHLAEDAAGRSPAKAVHETRKALKRVRALMALLEHELSEPVFAREDAVLRDAGLRLAGARDAEVLVITLDRLIERHPRKLARRAGVVRLRERLVAEREMGTERALGDAAARREVLDELSALRARVVAWRIVEREGIEMIEPGLERLYRQGRRRYRRAARGRGDVARAMHRWRKRVKDLRYAAEVLDRRAPAGRGASGRGGGSSRRGRAQKRARPIGRVARRADELAELLGEEHDLGLLAVRVKAAGGRGDARGLRVGRGTQATLLKLIVRRRRRLRSDALRRGARLYRRPPKRFVRRVGELYARSTHPHRVRRLAGGGAGEDSSLSRR